MPGIQFSSRLLLLIVAAVAACLTALLYPLPQIVHGLDAFLWLALFYSVLAVVYRRGTTRAFWLGFAVFGIGNKLLVDDTLSEPLLALLHRARLGIPDHPLAGNQLFFKVQYTALLNVGDALESVFLALAGGAIGVYLYRTNRSLLPNPIDRIADRSEPPPRVD